MVKNPLNIVDENLEICFFEMTKENPLMNFLDD